MIFTLESIEVISIFKINFLFQFLLKFNDLKKLSMTCITWHHATIPKDYDVLVSYQIHIYA